MPQQQRTLDDACKKALNQKWTLFSDSLTYDPRGGASMRNRIADFRERDEKKERKIEEKHLALEQRTRKKTSTGRRNRMVLSQGSRR